MSAALLSQKSLVIIFASAPFGLGHLRVTDALYHGLPSERSPLLLGSQDTSISAVYRLVSTHTLTREVMEWSQAGLAERIYTYFYRFYAHTHTDLFYKQMVTLLEERFTTPETVLVVATHFGLAHQLAAIKKRLMKEKKLKMHLVVQVTDDSPQLIWYIPGADLICTPSELTHKALERYGRTLRTPLVPIITTPYPVSPLFAKNLSVESYQYKISQVTPQSAASTHLAIPISGAAVGTAYFTTLIDSLYESSHRYVFEVVVKTAPFTENFLHQMLSKSYVHLHVGTTDREVVDLYEKLFLSRPIALEITKPSEQAFKALLTPRHIGGPLLLFAQPVGRQEYDNLAFLRRHHLIPTGREQAWLWEQASRQRLLSKHTDLHLFEKAHYWRGVLLPHKATEAAQFISWCLREQLFSQMMRHEKPETPAFMQRELGSNGVERFWQTVVASLKQARS